MPSIRLTPRDTRLANQEVAVFPSVPERRRSCTVTVLPPDSAHRSGTGLAELDLPYKTPDAVRGRRPLFSDTVYTCMDGNSCTMYCHVTPPIACVIAPHAKAAEPCKDARGPS